MKDSLTDITLLLDRTGSMEVVRQETIQGVNTFLEEQKKVPGDALFTLIQFDSVDPFEVVQRGVKIQDAKPLTAATYVPRAWTPLLDAIGRTVNDTGARLSLIPEADRPGKIVLAIMTDGAENASREFSREKIIEMLKHQQEVYHWQVVYLGANQDAIQGAKDLGINVKNAMTYQHTGAGVAAAAASYSSNLSAYRMGKAVNMAFTDDDRKRQGNA